MTSQWVKRTWIHTGGSGANGLKNGILYLKPKKSYPFRAELPHIGHYVELKRAISDLHNEHTYLMPGNASLPPPMIVPKIDILSSF